MKTLLSIIAICAATSAFAQNTALPHGKTYGSAPNTAEVIPATKLTAFMGQNTRISTTISGKVTKVTKTKGGWFNIDAGNGKIIAAHFSVYNINIPVSLAGHTIIAEGVAQKNYIADASQHLAGGSGAPQKPAATTPDDKITFEVKGLSVDK